MTGQQYRLSEFLRLPDARTAVQACEGHVRVDGTPGLVLVHGLKESLEALPALSSAWGDAIEVVLIIVLPPDQFERFEPAIENLSRTAVSITRSATLDKELAHFEKLTGVGAILVSDRLELKIIREVIQKTGALLAQRGVELARAREEYIQTSRLSPTTDHEIAFKMLRTARRPVLMLDRRALLQNPPHPILNLAEEMHAPILLTTAATCAPPTIVQRWLQLAGDRVLFLPANNIVWLRSFMKADLILTLGARLRESEGFGLNDFHLTRADIVQVHPGSFQTDPNVKLFINNLAADFAENMLTLLRRMRPDESEPVLDYRLTNLRIKRLESLRHEIVQLHKGLERAADSAHQNQPLDPAAVTHAIVGRSAPDTLFIGEGNSTGMWMWSYLWLRPVLYPDLMASIGLALPWAMGVVQSADRRPIRIFLGDGSFLYQSGFLPELSGSGKDVTVFLYNNAAWSSIRLEQTFVFRGRYPGTELPQVDYTRIAQLHGWDTMRVENMEDLQAALNRADESGKKRPFFVDINLPRDSIPFAGIVFALAELDYIARPMLSRVTRSALRAMLQRKVPYRIIGMILRILFS